MTDRGCTTADCEGLPRRMVRLYDVPGEGPWPYCLECATSLASGGDEDCGPFDPVTDEMVERAARALYEHRVGLVPGEAINGAAFPQDVESARIALAAALSETPIERPETDAAL